jgi:hypothetical protein
LAGSTTYYNDGNVGIGTDSPGAKLEINGRVKINGGSPGSGKVLTSDYNGLATWQTPTSSSLWTLSGSNIYYNDGYVGIGTTSPASKLTVKGNVRTLDSGGDIVCYITTVGGGGGYVGTYGTNGNYNVALTNLSGYDNNGYVAVKDSSGNTQAGIYVDSSGNGQVFGDTKSFRVPNPNQPGTEIWYACIEGPEAAAYVRGTGQLTNGVGEVLLPDHFVAVASTEGLTVQVTPLSAESKGLAVVQKTTDRFVVRELHNGQGSYDFDYMVIAIRKGYEEYEVIRPSAQNNFVGEMSGDDILREAVSSPAIPSEVGAE